jgi:hypothetical protein
VDPIENLSKKADLKPHLGIVVQERAPRHNITLLYADRTAVNVMHVTAKIHDEFRWFPQAFE